MVGSSSSLPQKWCVLLENPIIRKKSEKLWVCFDSLCSWVIWFWFNCLQKMKNNKEEEDIMFDSLPEPPKIEDNLDEPVSETIVNTLKIRWETSKIFAWNLDMQCSRLWEKQLIRNWETVKETLFRGSMGTFSSLSTTLFDSFNQNRKLEQNYHYINLRHHVGWIFGGVFECQFFRFGNEFLSSCKFTWVLPFPDKCSFSSDGFRSKLDSWSFQARYCWLQFCLGLSM